MVNRNDSRRTIKGLSTVALLSLMASGLIEKALNDFNFTESPLTNKVSVEYNSDLDLHKELSATNFRDLSTKESERIPKSVTLSEDIQRKLQSTLQNTSLQGLEKSIVATAQKYSVDPVFIGAVMIHESAWGTSRLAKEKNNLFGLNAIDSDPYNKAYTFKTKADSIDHFGSLIARKYANQTLTEINKRYASDKNWSNKVKHFMDRIENETGQIVMK